MTHGLVTATPDAPAAFARGLVRLDALLLDSARAVPDSTVLHHQGRDWSYAEVAGRAAGVAAWLRDSGVTPGSRVVVLLPNGPEYPIVYFGVLLAGCCVVGLNPGADLREIDFVLRHSGASALCVVTDRAAELRPVMQGNPEIRAVLQVARTAGAPTEPAWPAMDSLPALADPRPARAPGEVDDLAQIIYTSGTTGRPKGVMLSHRNLAANTRSIISYLQLARRDSVLAILPFYYSYGNSLMLTHVAVGGRLVVASDFVFWNQALDLAERQQVTGFSGVPSSFAMLLYRSDLAKRRFPALRYMTCAGGPLPPANISRLRQLLPQVQLYIMYGQTEASARLTSLMPHELDARLGSSGRGIPGVEITVRDDEGAILPSGEVGELVARGENVMVGYWRDPEATAQVLRPEGLRTRDLARMDADGYVWIVGRKDDVIKSGAYRISPQEIEEALAELPGIAHVAVVGAPDQFLGEVPVAFVVGDGTALTEEGVLRAAQQRLPRYKSVRRVYLVDDLPRTSSGKVKRAELRQRLRQGTGA
ncbi:MAG TPA: class I adenylate-forming enzyme family protein [Gemmatimonadales bacterium]|nr:class I adenylate-forming enzyme family protein [Gemmatimonadales bacterium]